MKIKRIQGFENYYVSDKGDVFSLITYNNTSKKIKKLKQYKNWKGYLRIILYKDKTPYNLSVHRLVAEAFLPNPQRKPEVNHKNGISAVFLCLLSLLSYPIHLLCSHTVSC